MEKMIFAILLVFTNLLFAQEPYWEITDTMEYPIAGGNAVIQDGIIYLSGGYSKEIQDQVSWIQKYDPLLSTTEIIASMKNSRYGHVSVAFDESIYFVGGIHDSTEIKSSLEKWNLYGPDTTNLVASDSDFNRIFSTGIVYDSLIYLIGGNSYSDKDTSVLSYIIEYDIKNDSVIYRLNKDEYSDEYPEQQMSSVYGDNIYIFGGVLNGVLQSILKYNIPTRTLDTLEIGLLEPRAGGVAVRKGTGNEIYILGGFNEGNTALNTVEIFSIYGDNYYIYPGPELNEARKNLMAVSHDNDEIIVVGGYNENGEVVRTVEQLTESVTSVRDDQKPVSFALEQNYPNPFNPATTIEYSLPAVETGHASSLHVTLVVYDILGRVVALLVNEHQPPGNYRIKWHAGDLSTGIYFYSLHVYTNSGADSFIETKKMTVLK
jgi:hypothetical protein